MKKARSIFAVSLAVSLAGCGSKDSENSAKQLQQNPEKVAGKAVDIGGWRLTLPTTEELTKTGLNLAPTATGAVESQPLKITAASDSGELVDFTVKLIKNSCENFRTLAEQDEKYSGQLDEDVNWFVKMSGNEFERYVSVAKQYNHCLELIITPDSDVQIGSEQSDLLRYFKDISASQTFDRFFWIHERPDRYRNYAFTVIGDADVVFESVNGISTGISRSPFVTESGKTTEMIQTIKIGSCELSEFKSLLEDSERRFLATKALEKANFRYAILGSEDGASLNANGVYKAKDSTDCMIVDYALRDHFEDAAELENDRQLFAVLVGYFANPDEQLLSTTVVP